MSRYTTPQFSEDWVAAGRFPTGATVTITLINLATGAAVPLDVSTCTSLAASEVGTGGNATRLFVWPIANITTLPTLFTQYAYTMVDSVTGEIREGKVSLGGFPDQAALAQYNGAIWFSSAVVNTDSELGVDGHAGNPVSSQAAVRALLDAAPSIRTVRVRGNFGTVDTLSFAGISFVGTSPESDFVDADIPTGGSLAGCTFDSIGLSGDFNGQNIDAERSFFNNTTNVGSGTHLLCAYLGTVSPALGADWRMEQPRGGATFADFFAGGVELDLTNSLGTLIVGAGVGGLWRLTNGDANNLIVGFTCTGAQITLENTMVDALSPDGLTFIGTGRLFNESALLPSEDGGPIADDLVNGHDNRRLFTGNQEHTLYFAQNGTGAPRNVPATALSHIRVRTKDELSVDWTNPIDTKWVVYTYRSGATASDRPDSSLTQFAADEPADDIFDSFDPQMSP